MVVEPDVPSFVARTARSYDALPYTSIPFPNTHPSLLAAIARLFAVEAAPMRQAQVLELGCASGGNIIPLAARYPQASFIGVDLSRTQVAEGETRIARLGLSNIEMRCQSFADFSAGGAAFDYVICHGVYSWVPAALRETILRICSETLSPRGIALISYNALPGWRMLQVLRDCFLLHGSLDADPRQRVAEARGLLEFLPQACAAEVPYRDFVAAQAARLEKCPDDYLAHEFLDDICEPFSFRDFVDAARHCGLAYLAEAELPSMIVTNYPPHMAEIVKRMGGDRLLATEQLIDMVSARTFRNTLLIAADRTSRIDRQLTNARLDGLHFVGDGTLRLTREAGGATLAAQTGRRLHGISAPLEDALAQFLAGFPASSSIDDLVQALPARARNAEGRALVRDALLNMVVNGLATARLDPVRAAAAAGARPLACPMVRADAACGAASTANLRHERVELGDLARVVLPLLDGTRDAAALAIALAESQAEPQGNSALAFTRGGIGVGDSGERRSIAVRQLDALLPSLARAGLLLAQ